MKATGVHRDRKNPRMAELWRERKKAANAARGKQRYERRRKEYVLIPPEKVNQ